MAKKRTTSEAASDDHDGQPGRRILKRASQACEICRNRKVRCDVTSVPDGEPCHNCKFAGTECIVPESNRKRRWQSKPIENGHPGHLGRPEATLPVSLPVDLNPFDTNQPEYQPIQDISVPSVPRTDYFVNGGQNAHSLHQVNHTNGSFPALNSDSSVRTASIHGEPHPSPKNVRSASVNSQAYDLPGYIQPLPSNMDPEDLAFLQKKGALSMPDTRLRNALLTSYVDYVFPNAPTIDLLSFLDVVNNREGEHGKVSLLLFRSILFAGVAYVDFHYLSAAGYKTRRQARKEFYKVCRLLHDFDYEKNRVTLIQSLLLLTYWYETADDPRDTWHWMGVAISLSHTIGLHKNPSESKMALSAQRLWKRIWWACYMRDREIAIGMRRPIRIKESDYEVPMLAVEDFDFGILPESNTTINRNCTLIRNVEMQKQMAAMCVAKAELSTLMILPKKNLDPEEVESGGRELRAWSENLAPSRKYVTPTYENVSNGKSCLAVQKALVHMLYYTALQVLMSIENTQLHLSSEDSQARVREAAHSNTRIAHDLYRLDLDRFLPNVGISVILPALINHLLDIKSSSDQTRDAALRGFSQSLKVLERLRDNYAAADFAVRFCQTAIKQGNITLPVDHPKPSTDLFPSLDQITNLGPSAATPAGYQSNQMEVVQQNPKLTETTMEEILGNEYFDQQFNEDFGTFAFEEFFDIPIENGEWLIDGQASWL